MRIVPSGRLARVIQKHREQLVGRDRMEREESVCNEVDGDVAREDLAHSGRRIAVGGLLRLDNRRGAGFGE